MTAELASHNLARLNRETRKIWNEIAGWWDEQVGEGNDFQRLLIGPATERLLSLQPGETVLDVACGNGHFARRMADLGAEVVAFDFSEVFLEKARQRGLPHGHRIAYRLIDATDPAQLLSLGERQFDAAVCTMALMDMAQIEPLLSTLSRLLKRQGRFVFSVLHPCFNNPDGCTLVVEEAQGGEQLSTVHAVKVSRYIHPSSEKGVGIPGQPEAHYYFHRPLSILFSACLSAGFVLDGIEEPTFDQPSHSRRPLGWADFREIPPVLVARMRLAEAEP